MTDRKIAIVTGANRGLGLETCRQLARKGYHVVLAARDKKKAETAANALKDEGLTVETAELDVARDDQVSALADRLRKDHGRVDVLVNNAGVYLDSSASGADPVTVPPEIVMQTLDINTLGALRMIQALVPLMPRGARIVNVSSGMGQLEDMNGGSLGYRVSKAALNVVSRVLANELRGKDIAVNSVCPGWVRTDMGGSNAQRDVAKGVETIVWLASDPAAIETGGFYRDKRRIAW